MQPVTIRRCSPCPFRAPISRIVSIDSCFAASMNPQVLTMTTSASSRSFVIVTSASACNCPSMISASTRFLGQPREIIPTRRTDFSCATTVMNSVEQGLPDACSWPPPCWFLVAGSSSALAWTPLLLDQPRATSNQQPATSQLLEYGAGSLVRGDLGEGLVQGGDRLALHHVL